VASPRLFQRHTAAVFLGNLVRQRQSQTYAALFADAHEWLKKRYPN
jgi:hypothetical protein